LVISRPWPLSGGTTKNKRQLKKLVSTIDDRPQHYSC
jgi:hypothetical protein